MIYDHPERRKIIPLPNEMVGRKPVNIKPVEYKLHYLLIAVI